MNREGFTTVELLLTMVLVVIIMATITTVTYVYRDRSEYEKELSEVINYKNNVTKIIYDDILATNSSDKVTSIRKIDDNNYRLVKSSGENYLIIIDEVDRKGITYGSSSNLFDYIIPGSDEGLVEIDGVNFKSLENNVYTFELYFHHLNLDKSFKIKFTIS